MRQSLIVADNSIQVNMWYLSCLLLYAILHSSYGVSSKMDFGNEEEVTVTNSSKIEDEDVEVKHTIVVSTKLKNNNRRGFAPSDVSGDGALTYSVGTPKDKDNSGEVPVVPGYKSVESTRIRTPDTRLKSRIYPDSVFVNRNIRDELDIVPNLATNPMQWKPSNYFNNINWWTPEARPQNSFVRRNERPLVDNSGRFHKKITADGMKEFYCRRCRELSVGIVGQHTGCVQQRSNPWVHETTTPKMKLDGKLAKLN
ncbi:uncharacterized protein LOC106133520 [Amyelois transitella]|uniref:uncharacterized protein LOC106133520 n=1 Tax=Amyelois transitella TaxID=680683 RepID=UPI0029902ADE|nr:uncharacterized protein LOC106133520 [Amyelois transitella]